MNDADIEAAWTVFQEVSEATSGRPIHASWHEDMKALARALADGDPTGANLTARIGPYKPERRFIYYVLWATVFSRAAGPSIYDAAYEGVRLFRACRRSLDRRLDERDRRS